MDNWDSDKLWLKAKFFIDKANSRDQQSTDFALGCALALECLARSALTKVHPVLNADPREDVNLLSAFGYEVTSKPRSLPAHSVYLRLEKIVPNFGKTQRELCDFVALLRNAHLHTAELPYDNLQPVRWLPRYYEVVKILNIAVGKELADFLGDDLAENANRLIGSLNREILSSVKRKIAAHKKVFESKTEDEQNRLKSSVNTSFVLWRIGHTHETCPACGEKGILTGNKVKEFPTRYEDEELVVDVQFSAEEFLCDCCGLALKGIEEILHAEIATHFVETTATSLHELYEPEYYREYDNM